MREIIERTKKHFSSVGSRLTITTASHGVATYLVRAAIGLVVVGLVWWLGNMLLFGEIGVVNITENLNPSGGYEDSLGDIDQFVLWAWKGFLFFTLATVFAYAVYGAIKEEVLTR